MNNLSRKTLCWLCLCFCLTGQALMAQSERRVSGTVVDETGLPIIGANVSVKGSSVGTITDMDGNFAIEVDKGKTLVVTYIGYSAKEIAAGAQSPLKIQLSEDTQKLEEVVVIGYGTSSKKRLTTAVSNVKSDNIQEMPITNIGDALSGRIAGLMAENGTGQPGTNLVMRIRGFGSINAGSEPLYVIDGVMSTAAMFAALNPKSIESIDVLKDAAAGAIYGSRAGNGVIQVTTKKGKYGDGRIAVNATFGIQQLERKVRVLNRDEWMGFIKECYVNDKKALPDFYNQPVSSYANTDWQDEIFRTSTYQSYQISASGATDKVSYYIDGNILDNEGIIKTTYAKNYSSTGNFEFKVKPRWKVGLNYNALYGKERVNNSVGGFGHMTGGYGVAGGILQQALWVPPIIPVYTANGDYGHPAQGDFAPFMGGTFSNPVAGLNETNDTYDKVKALGKAMLSYEPIDGLVLNASMSGSVDSYNRIYNTSPYLAGQYSTQTNFSRPAYDKMTAGQENYMATSWIADLYANYKKTFNDIHSLDATLGYSAQYDGFTATRAFGAANDRGSANSLNPIPIFGNNYRPNIYGAAMVLGGGAYQQTSFESIFARVSYSLKDRYIFMASVRRDGSSKFAPDNRYGYFPAVSGAWRASEEEFLKDQKWLNDLKVRLSYGISGNDQFGAYQWQGRVNYGSLYTYGPVSDGGTGSDIALVPSTIENRKLSWETNEQINVGIDLSVLDSRIGFTADYFIRNTRDMLLGRAIPLENGITSSILDNVGNMTNKGIELSLNTVNIKNKDWTWNTSFNFTKINNRVDKVFTSTGYIQYDADFYGSGFESALRIVEGQPMFQIYSFKSLGVFQSEEELNSYARANNAKVGDPKVEDVDNNKIINNDDLQPVGKALPDFSIGISSMLKYKNFDFSFLLDGSFGASNIITGARQGSLLHTSANTLKEWYDDRYVPGSTTARFGAPSANVTGPRHWNVSYFVADASFLRVKNITLGYNLPKSACQRIRINDMRFTLSVQNAHTFTSYPLYNPQANTKGGGAGSAQFGVDNGVYPLARIYTIGLNFNF